ncbi:MAG: hypothetical protein LDL56_07305 [Armatimonadetes bacterium]|nr:hypothetical protein [Armatimonadota bacterium]
MVLCRLRAQAQKGGLLIRLDTIRETTGDVRRPLDGAAERGEFRFEAGHDLAQVHHFLADVRPRLAADPVSDFVRIHGGVKA